MNFSTMSNNVSTRVINFIDKNGVILGIDDHLFGKWVIGKDGSHWGIEAWDTSRLNKTWVPLYIDGTPVVYSIGYGEFIDTYGNLLGDKIWKREIT